MCANPDDVIKGSISAWLFWSTGILRCEALTVSQDVCGNFPFLPERDTECRPVHFSQLRKQKETSCDVDNEVPL